MDVRRLGSRRQASPKKRPGLRWAAALLAAAVAAVVAVGATTAGASTQTLTWVSDPSTADGFSAILGNEEPLNSRFAGRVWTDKSVTTDAAQGAQGVFHTTFSALGSSRVVNREVENPLDVAFIVDLSGSMDNERMEAATEALDATVKQLMEANPYNRVAVSTFSSDGRDANRENPILPLGHYDKTSFTYRRATGTAVRSLTVTASGQPGAAVNTTVSVEGGTNTQMGVYRGMQPLARASDTTLTVGGTELRRVPAVVLLSDGAPTYSQNATDWWNPASGSQVGIGNAASVYWGNGMLTLMEASYWKQQVDRHYGVDGASSTQVFTVRVGDLTGNELNLANVTLDPARYLDQANGALSSQAKDINDAWNTYRNGGRPSVQVGVNEYWPYRPVNVTLNHPAAADDISSLAYNDGAYVAGTDDLSDIFASIITQLQQTAFNPVTDAMGEAATPLTYRDPIGRYMTVREVQGVELFGTTYPVTENADGTYSLPSREVVNPVYGTSFNLGDIKVSVDTGDDGTEELTCVLPADALPVRVETITVDGSGNQTDYTSNRGSVEAQPFRLHYTVGFSDAVISNGAVDLTRVDADYKAAHRNADGGVDFYSNRYSAKGAADAEGPDSTRTVGDAMVTFAPSASNRFYYFQANRPVYGDGTEGELGEGGSVGTQLTSLDQIDPDGTYYVVVDYHRQGSARIVQCVVPFSGAELMAQDSVEVVDGAVATRIGSPLLGNARWAAIPKAGNPTGTASLSLSPLFDYTHGEASDYQVVQRLGNNGRVTVPDTAVRVQKAVSAAEGVTAPDRDFTFTVTAPGRPDGQEELTVYEPAQDGGWTPVTDADGKPVTQTVTWAGGKATVVLKAGQSVFVELAPGTRWSVSEEPVDDPAFSLVDREGTGGAVADPDDGTAVSGTALGGTVQGAVFTNAYTTTATWDGIRLNKVMEGDLASGEPRGFRVGDHFSFEIDAMGSAPLPQAPRADGSGDFPASSVEVSVEGVNDDGTLDLSSVYRGTAGDESAPRKVQGAADFSAAFPSIVFDAPSPDGGWVYAVWESRATAQNVVAGVTYDPTVYQFGIPVTADPADPSALVVGDVTVGRWTGDSADQDPQPVEGYAPGDPVTFINTYDTSEVRRFFGVRKTLSGTALEDGRFTFTLTGVGAHPMDADDVAALAGGVMTRGDAEGYPYDGASVPPMPDGVTGNTVTAQNNAGGLVPFGGIRFEQASASVVESPDAETLHRGVVYKYTVAENVPAGATGGVLDGVTYDTVTRDIYVYVHVEAGDGGEVVRSQLIYPDDSGVDGDRVTFANSYQARGEAPIQAVKAMDGRPFREGDTFTFTLSELSAGGVETLLQEKTVTVSAAEAGTGPLTVPFDALTYVHDGARSDLGTHTYVLREVAPAAGDALAGVSYDTAPRTVTVEVSDNGDGTLSTAVAYPDGADRVAWTNRYDAPVAAVALPGTKTFEGGPIPSQSFGFSTWVTDDTYNTDGVTPSSTWVGEGTSDTAPDGSVSSTAPIPSLLPSGTYGPGEYHFVVAENPGSSAGVTYDPVRYQVHLTVTDNFDGTATPSVEVRSSTDGGATWGEWGEPADGGLAFTNAFEGVGQAVARLSKVTLDAEAPAEGYGFELRIQRWDDDGGRWVAAKVGEVRVQGLEPGPDGTYSLRSGADGSIPLGDLVFLREGTYRTDLTEVLPSGDRIDLGNGSAVVDGMAYDTHTASAAYHVVRSGVSLTVNRLGANTLAFVNDGGVPVSKAVYADDVADPSTLPQGPFTFTVSGLGEGQTAYLVVDGTDEAVALTDGGTFELSGGQSGRIYGLGQGGSIKLTESAQDGFTPDSAELTGTVVPGAAAEGAAFRNKYTPGVAKQQFSVSKELTGRDFKDGESFTFTLAGEGDAPMPTEDGRTVTVSENDGRAAFGEIAFDRVGTYTYTVAEQAGDDGDGLAYDRSVYTVTVDVTYDAETKALTSVASYTKDGQPYEPADGAMAFTNAYASTGKLTGDAAARLDVTKTLAGRDMTDGQFTFAVEPVDTDGAKASEKLGAVELHSVAAKAGEAAKAVNDKGETLGDLLGAVTFTQADAGKTFSWTVSENGADSPAPGYTMDTSVYTLSVSVTDNGDGTVTATPSVTKDGEEADAAAFANGYGVETLTVPVTDQVKVGKELTGRALKDGEFTFELVDGNGDVVATGTNAADGTVTFDRDLTFSAAGEYAYTLREVKGGLAGITYDETAHDIVLTVTDNGDGTLSVSRKEGTPESVTFKNAYTSTGSMDGVASVNVTKVLTGRPLAAGQFSFLVSPDDDASAAKLAETSLTNQAAAAGEPAAAVSPDGKALSELFSAIAFTQADAGKTFSWTVSEKGADKAPDGYRLDSSTHRVTVRVADDGAGKITATTSVDGTEVTSGTAEVRFTNAYGSESDPGAAEGSGRLTAKKELTGRKLGEGEFTFVMRDAKGNEVKTVTNAADGTVDFGAVHYTSDQALKDVADGIATMAADGDGNPVYRYTYTLSEDEAELPGLVTPSVSSIVVSVDVTDNGDGTMTCDVTWPESGSTFKNAYRAEDVNLSIVGAKVFSVPDGLDGVDAESLAGKFGFTLSDQDGKELATATNDASGQVAFPPITYTHDSLGGAEERTFTYTVTETGSVPGVTNDGEAKTVTVTLSQNEDGSLSARVGGEGPDFTFTNSYGVGELASSVTDQVKVTKTLTGRAMAEGEFHFRLVDAATGETVAQGTNKADGTVELSPITYTEPGTYTYVLSEVAGDAPSMSYDESEFTVTTTVTDKGNGELEAEHVVEGGSVTFENTYTPAAARATLSVSKRLVGRDFREGETFSFTLVPQDGAPMPAAGGETATVSENQRQADFGAITFTAPGEYRYTVSEVGGGTTEDGVTYDGSTFTAVVTVGDDGRSGRLEATVAYRNADGAPVTIPSFVNTYASTGSMDGVASVNVLKTLTGRPMAAGQFSFSVTPADEASTAKLAETSLTNQASATSGAPAAVVTADGKTLSQLLSAVTFTLEDAGKTFAWTVAETSEAAPGYTVDRRTHTVEVRVADNGNGTISATTSVDGTEVSGDHGSITFENGYHAESDPGAAEGSGRVSTTKEFAGRPLAAGEFTFVMRDAKGNEVATATNAADGTVDFGAARYTSDQALQDVASGVAVQTGTADKPVYRYTYTLSEVTDALPENVSAEVPTVTVAVDVTDNGDGTMTCSVVWPSEGTPAGFVNAYEADPVDLTVAGTKVFTAAEGLSVPDSVYGAYTFTLTDEAGNVLGTATNDRSGSVAFPPITYTQDSLGGETERTFTYTVTETGSVPGVTNDADPSRTVVVRLVQGADGRLHTEVTGLPFTFTNTYGVEALDTSVTDQVKVTKNLDGRPLADGEFRFQLVDEDGEVAASGTNAADGTVTLSPVTYTQPGVYTYTLVEVNDGKPGITYDDAVYTVTTTVVDDDGTLSATHEVAGGEAVFDNAFTATPVVDPAFGVAAKKVLVGRDWTDDDAFDLVVTAETEGAPMPDPAIVTATKESPMGTFGAVTFSEPGTYSYLVGEKAGDEEGMAYSQALYRVVYEVTKDEATGGLSMAASVTRVRSDDGADVDEACPADAPMEFVNTYTAPEGPGEPGGPGQPEGPGEPGGPEEPGGPGEPGIPGQPSDLVEKLPEPLKAVVVPVTGLIAKTGDVVAPLLPWIGAGAAAITAGALRVLKGGRRRKD